jgi:hypothetical protein
MINTSHHEDDDFRIAEKDLEALVVEGGKTSDAFQVIIPEREKIILLDMNPIEFKLPPLAAFYPCNSPASLLK